jgi:hypothetical protein
MERCRGTVRVCAATIVAACGILAFLTLPSAADEQTSSGTGFLVNASGDMITNAHVVDECTQVKVSGIGGASLQFIDVQNDLAVIRTAPQSEVRPLSVRRSPPRLGEDVAAFGYPLSDILSDSVKITTGNINSLVGMANDSRYLQISAPIQPGNSGGPLVDRAGHVIGISTATLGTKYAAQTGILPQNVNFAIRASVLEAFLQARGVAFQTVETAEAPLATPDLAELVSKSVFQILCYQARPAPPPAVSEAPQQPAAPQPQPQQPTQQPSPYTMTCRSTDSGNSYPVSLIDEYYIQVDKRTYSVTKSRLSTSLNSGRQALVANGMTHINTQFTAVFGGVRPRMEYSNGKRKVTDLCW